MTVVVNEYDGICIVVQNTISVLIQKRMEFQPSPTGCKASYENVGLFTFRLKLGFVPPLKLDDIITNYRKITYALCRIGHHTKETVSFRVVNEHVLFQIESLSKFPPEAIEAKFC